MKPTKITVEQAKEKWPPETKESMTYKMILNDRMIGYNQAIADMEKLKKPKRDKLTQVERMIVGVNPEIMAQVSALTDRITLLETLHENHCIATSHQRDKLFDLIDKLETQIEVIQNGDTQTQQDMNKRLKVLESLHYNSDPC